MVSFDLRFRSMLIKDIFEDEVALLSEGSISWISINGDSYQENRVQVADGNFCTCVGLSLGAVF